MKFQQAIDSALFKNYFNLEGKATRSEYWWFGLFVVLLIFATPILATTVAATIGLYEVSGVVKVVNYSIGIVLAVTFLPYLGVSVRRFRDAGRGKEEAIVVFFLAIITQLMVPIGDQEAIIRMPEIMTVPILVVGVAASFYSLYIALKKSV